MSMMKQLSTCVLKVILHEQYGPSHMRLKDFCNLIAYHICLELVMGYKQRNGTTIPARNDCYLLVIMALQE
jgi:hypothetical protein